MATVTRPHESSDTEKRHPVADMEGAGQVLAEYIGR